MSTKTTPKPGQRPIGAASQSVSAVDRAKQLNLPPKPTSAAGSTGATVSATATPSQKKSATELRAKLAIASPPPSTPPQSAPQRHQATRQDDDLDGSILTLKARDILPYDKNPRGSMNPKYHQIKASIKAEGRLNGTLAWTNCWSLESGPRCLTACVSEQREICCRSRSWTSSWALMWTALA